MVSMPFQNPDEQLTGEAAAILESIREETRALRQLELGDAPPAAVFEAE
jgi:hypothetical protein